MRTLVVAAHPDDEVLGCGGTIARTAETDDVVIAILGEGATSRATQNPGELDHEVTKLKRSAKEAQKVLGAQELIMTGLPDNRFDELPLLEIVKTVERILQEVRPGSVLTHHPSDLNIDHQLTARAVTTATRPGASVPVAEVASFEVPSSSEWSYGITGQSFQPNLFIDINEFLDRKIQAMECYANEVRSFPHPRSEEALRSIAAARGSAAGMHAAEAFQIVRALR